MRTPGCISAVRSPVTGSSEKSDSFSIPMTRPPTALEASTSPPPFKRVGFVPGAALIGSV